MDEEAKEILGNIDQYPHRLILTGLDVERPQRRQGVRIIPAVFRQVHIGNKKGFDILSRNFPAFLPFKPADSYLDAVFAGGSPGGQDFVRSEPGAFGQDGCELCPGGAEPAAGDSV